VNLKLIRNAFFFAQAALFIDRRRLAANHVVHRLAREPERAFIGTRSLVH